MKKIILLFYILSTLIFSVESSMGNENKNLLYLDLEYGRVVIEMKPEVAPGHVERIKKLVSEGLYDGVVFHRVIDGFMAQTGDVLFGNSQNENFNIDRAGTGGSKYPDLKAEFSKLNHERGTVSMARAQDPNSANSQFFICFGDASSLNEQYTVWGQVIEGMEFVDKIKKGDGSNGSVSDPDKIIKMQLAE